MNSNVYNSGSRRPTVLKFGEHTRVCVSFMLTKFGDIRFTRFQSSKSEVLRVCAVSTHCAPRSLNLHNSASCGPITLGFGQQLPSDVL